MFSSVLSVCPCVSYASIFLKVQKYLINYFLSLNPFLAFIERVFFSSEGWKILVVFWVLCAVFALSDLKSASFIVNNEKGSQRFEKMLPSSTQPHMTFVVKGFLSAIVCKRLAECNHLNKGCKTRVSLTLSYETPNLALLISANCRHFTDMKT